MGAKKKGCQVPGCKRELQAKPYYIVSCEGCLADLLQALISGGRRAVAPQSCPMYGGRRLPPRTLAAAPPGTQLSLTRRPFFCLQRYKVRPAGEEPPPPLAPRLRRQHTAHSWVPHCVRCVCVHAACLASALLQSSAPLLFICPRSAPSTLASPA